MQPDNPLTPSDIRNQEDTILPPPPTSPIATPAAAAAGLTETAPMSSSAAAPSTRPRILIIEDDMASADAMVSLLETANYEVEVATDAQYGLMLVETFSPEVILLETNLPGMSGHEMTSVLRTAPQYASRFRSMHILYLADNRSILQQRFHSLPDIPMSSYLFKPVNPAELLDKVERIFAGTPNAAT